MFEELEVKCPHCGFENKEVDLFEMEDGDVLEVECEKCDEWFYYKLGIIIEYVVMGISKKESEL